ncbi:site-specific integrase [Anaerococcus sp. mt242]|uniref:tyrosine-type recombinase/integrase n=1 Tax=Anaerococcus sp. mt242 TaxID=2661917 RepID=UPI0019347EB8|nr:site-specific integrase [Anaerococcus sp. mt242]MBM0046663.1 site-specific integrase [Anaerococcus sp. mt242]
MAKRRKLPNGTGSIERVKKTPQGKTRLNQYRARLPAKKGRKDIGFYKTYNEAMDALINYQDPAKTETFEALYQKTKQTKAFRDLTHKTKIRYDSAYEKFEPIHSLNITEITYTDLQEIIDQMDEEGYYKTINGEYRHQEYSKGTLKYLKFVVNKIYTTAIRNNIQVTNLAPTLTLGGAAVGTKRQKTIFTKDEINQMIDQIDKVPNIRHVLIMIFTGMRPGEYRELERSNIDFDTNTISNFGIKTEAGQNRKIFIHPKIRNLLMDLTIESQSGYILEYKGKALKHDKRFYDDIYYPALKDAGIERKIPYTCRYTFATIAHNSGVDNKALQKLMGHTDFNITANSYIQDLDEFIYEELQKIQ